MFKIGHTSEPELQLHMYYDFSHPKRDDARVTMREADGDEDYKRYETLREMIATKAVVTHAMRANVYCEGTMQDSENILPQLIEVLKSLSINQSEVITGLRCGLFEGRQATLVTTSPLDLDPTCCGFVFGADSSEVLRKILGSIALETSFDLDVENDPRQLPNSPK